MGRTASGLVPMKPLNKIQKSARGKDCTGRLHCCNRDPLTTILAHAPFTGKFGSRKHWWWAAYLCSDCHDYLDNRDRVNTQAELNALWLNPVHETQEQLIDQELIEVRL